jgi:hypothetical protein
MKRNADLSVAVGELDADLTSRSSRSRERALSHWRMLGRTAEKGRSLRFDLGGIFLEVRAAGSRQYVCRRTEDVTSESYLQTT